MNEAKGYLVSPTGYRITGTVESLVGMCGIDVWKDKDGKMQWEHDNCGTKVYWDCGETRTNRRGNVIVQDTQGCEWSIKRCRFVEGEPE